MILIGILCCVELDSCHMRPRHDTTNSQEPKQIGQDSLTDALQYAQFQGIPIGNQI